jgi:hypothetical protein
MRRTFALAVLVILTSLCSEGNAGRAAVVVLANRAEDDVRLTISSTETKSRSYTIAKGEVIALPVTGDIEISYSAGATPNRRLVRRDEIYYFLGSAKQLQLKQVGFTDTWSNPQQAPPEDNGARADQRAVRPDAERENKDRTLLKVPVKILVDQAEPSVQNVWEKRLRRRVEDASDILEGYCRVRFEVVEVGTWESDERLLKLSELLRDLRAKVTPGKARLAIGFTGLRPEKNEDRALGCTHAPLHSHILLREYKLKSEAERLEVLVHELGHFLGACHSPEGDSVMRPRLGDGRANLRAFRIGFDPVNLLVVNLVADELARRPVRSLAQLSPPLRKRLIAIFATLARAMPDDPAAPIYVRMLGAIPPEPLTVRTLDPEVFDAARSVVAAITAESRRIQERSARSGDALTELYFRMAAAKCRQLPAEQSAAAYTLGLAIALDRSSLLRSLALRGIPWDKIESDDERQQRLAVMSEPTMYGRASLAQSFVVAAAMLLLVEGQAVSAAGLQEEFLRIHGGYHFRFDDLMASVAGITFATQLDASPDLLDELAKSFRVADFLLPAKGLPAPLDRDEFSRQFGSMTDERFLNKQDVLRKRLLTLPGYQPRQPRKEGMLIPAPGASKRVAFSVVEYFSSVPGL